AVPPSGDVGPRKPYAGLSPLGTRPRHCAHPRLAARRRCRQDTRPHRAAIDLLDRQRARQGHCDRGAGRLPRRYRRGPATRLSEADAATIDRNQQAFRSSLIAMKANFDAKLAEIEDPSVISLSSDLAYITTGLGVDVAAFFPKSEYDWTDADAKALVDKMKA